MIETKIIQGCKNLDPKYQRVLVEKYAGVLYTVCRRYLGDGAKAKDALQEGLIRIFKHIDRFDSSKGGFLPWMKKIVANESLKIIRMEGRFFSEEITDSDLPIGSVNILDRLNEEDLIKLINTLPSGYREVFNMYVIDGYSHKEIGEFLDIEAATSRSQLTRARKLLKQKIYMIENLQLCHKNK